MLNALIVSTNRRLADALSRAISLEEGDPSVVGSFQAAVDALQHQRYRLIFLEVGIEDIDIPTSVAVIRETCEPDTPKVVALLDDPLASKHDLARAGFDDVLRIPLELADIALLIRSAERSANLRDLTGTTDRTGDAPILRQLSLDLAWSTTLEQQAQHGLKAACKLLGTERGAIWVRDPDDRKLKCVTQSGLSDDYGALGGATLNFLSSDEWLEISRRPVFATESSRKSGATSELIRREKLRNSLTAALFTPECVIGSLVLFDLPTEAAEPDEEALQLIDTVTAITAMAIDQSRLGADLRNSEATYRQLVEEMPHGVFVHDAQGNFLMSNSAIESICGYSGGDLALMSLFDLLRDGPGGQDGKLLDEVLSELARQRPDDDGFGEMFGPVTLNFAGADGRPIEAELYFRSLRLDGRDGELWIQAMARDVTNEVRTLRQLEALRGVAESLGGIDDEHQALKEALSQISHSIDYVHASVWRLSPDGRELLCAAQHGVERSELLARPDNGPVGEALASRRTIHIRGLHDYADAGAVNRQVAGIAVVPIYVAGQAAGALELQNGAGIRINDGDLDLLKSAGVHIAGRFERLDLIQQIQKLDQQDATTGLDNRRTFYQRLNAACDRAGDRSVSLLHIDIDGFKGLNDTYGHVVGDELLHQIGETIRGHLAPPYNLARYGGDEFCVILPGIGRDEISAAAEEIRIGVATQLFKAEDQLEHLTVSIGVATMPDDVERPDKLIAAACDASLMAKQAGRNQVYQSNSAFGELSMQQEQLVKSLRQSPQHTLSLLVRAMDERLDERSGHAARVARLAMTLGDHLGMEGQDLDHLGVAGYIHDIGMFLIPDELLRKPVDLSNSERERLAIVPAVAHRLLSQVSLPGSVSLAVVHQYEHWDGTGYPGRLGGTSIPLAARIIAVADALDAMTSPRAHRDPLALPEVMANLRAESGTRFDPDVVAAAEMVYDEADPSIKDVKTAFLQNSLVDLGVTPSLERASAPSGNTTSR